MLSSRAFCVPRFDIAVGRLKLIWFAMFRPLIVATTSLILAGCTAPSQPVSNIAIICIDTVRFDIFDALGHGDFADALTPYMSDAQHFTDAQSTAPWTIPSVASVITGLYPPEHGAGRFPSLRANLNKEVPSILGEDVVTLAEVMKGAGFETAGFVAHPWFAFDFGLEQGFDVMLPRKGREKVIEFAFQWHDNDHDPQRRFFNYLHFMEAHDWHLVAEEDLDQRIAGMDDALIDLARDLAPADICATDALICKRFLVYVLAVQEQRLAIAAYLDGLKQRGVLKHTAVIVYADHGEEFHDHLEEGLALKEDPRGIYGFGHGQSMYQELLHVPLIAWHPHFEGQRIGAHVSLVDIVPSILEWTGVTDEALPVSGVPLTAAMRGEQADLTALPTRLQPLDEEPRPIYSSGTGYGHERVAVRQGDMKSVLRRTDRSSRYFDLATDPLEQNAIQVGDGWLMAFDRMTGDYTELTAAYLAKSPELSAEQIERLKSIGYLQGVNNEENP